MDVDGGFSKMLNLFLSYEVKLKKTTQDTSLQSTFSLLRFFYSHRKRQSAKPNYIRLGKNLGEFIARLSSQGIVCLLCRISLEGSFSTNDSGVVCDCQIANVSKLVLGVNLILPNIPSFQRHFEAILESNF